MVPLLRFAILKTSLSNASSAIFCARLMSPIGTPFAVTHHARICTPRVVQFLDVKNIPLADAVAFARVRPYHLEATSLVVLPPLFGRQPRAQEFLTPHLGGQVFVGISRWRPYFIEEPGAPE